MSKTYLFYYDASSFIITVNLPILTPKIYIFIEHDAHLFPLNEVLIVCICVPRSMVPIMTPGMAWHSASHR